MRESVRKSEITWKRFLIFRKYVRSQYLFFPLSPTPTIYELKSSRFTFEIRPNSCVFEKRKFPADFGFSCKKKKKKTESVGNLSCIHKRSRGTYRFREPSHITGSRRIPSGFHRFPRIYRGESVRFGGFSQNRIRFSITYLTVEYENTTTTTTTTTTFTRSYCITKERIVTGVYIRYVETMSHPIVINTLYTHPKNFNDY